MCSFICVDNYWAAGRLVSSSLAYLSKLVQTAVANMESRVDMVQPKVGDYGSMSCGVFKRGVHNYKGFCLKINILEGNYWILRIGLMGTEVFKNHSFKSQLISSSQK